MADGFGVEHTKNRPKESDLVGIYRPNLKTRVLINQKTIPPATNCAIILHSDGKIEFVEVGRWIMGDGDTNLPPVNFSPTNATWKLEYADHWHISWRYDHVSGDGLSLIGERVPYSIKVDNWHTPAPFY